MKRIAFHLLLGSVISTTIWGEDSSRKDSKLLHFCVRRVCTHAARNGTQKPVALDCDLNWLLARVPNLNCRISGEILGSISLGRLGSHG